MEFLNNHAKIIKVSSYSKQYWNNKLIKVRKFWVKDKKKLGWNDDWKQKLKQACNSYYQTIQKAKQLYWQNFL